MNRPELSKFLYPNGMTNVFRSLNIKVDLVIAGGLPDSPGRFDSDIPSPPALFPLISGSSPSYHAERLSEFLSSSTSDSVV